MVGRPQVSFSHRCTPSAVSVRNSITYVLGKRGLGRVHGHKSLGPERREAEQLKGALGKRKEFSRTE